MRIASDHLKAKSFPKGEGKEGEGGRQGAGKEDENHIKWQELKNKEHVFFFLFQSHVGGLPERLIKTKQKPTTRSYIMCRQVHTHTDTHPAKT